MLYVLVALSALLKGSNPIVFFCLQVQAGANCKTRWGTLNLQTGRRTVVAEMSVFRVQRANYPAVGSACVCVCLYPASPGVVRSFLLGIPPLLSPGELRDLLRHDGWLGTRQAFPHRE